MNSDETATVTATPTAGDALTAVHSDVILTHILSRLDGASLAATSCASAHLRALSTETALWSDICRATWPSTAHPRVRHFISSLPHGPRSFFSDAFPSVFSHHHHHQPETVRSPSELISAVDIHYKKNCFFSKVEEIVTTSGWFHSSPFRIDLLEHKDVVPTPITAAAIEDVCGELAEELSLTWIIADPAGRRAANFSSWKPVSVERHWLSGEIQARFSTVLAGDDDELVQCAILVALGGCEGGEALQAREVSFQVEDMEGISLNGKESLGILKRAIENGERRTTEKEESRVRYEEYAKKRRERRERQLRKEVRLDTLCTALGVSVFAAFSMLIFFY